MQLRRSVTLKVIVTEKFKEETARELEEAIQQVEQAKGQIDFRSRIYLTELQRVDLNQAAEFRRRVEAEKQRQDELKQHLEVELEEVKNAELDTEMTRGTLEGVFDVQIGDVLEDRLTKAEIVLKDGAVVELREPQPGA